MEDRPFGAADEPDWTPMIDNLPDSLLARLSEGDNEAAEFVFREYEPFLRVIVRRQLSPHLRAKFDSVDVVQSVWADLVQGFRSGDWDFSSADRLRSFLVQLTRNRFLDRLRHHEHILDHEQAMEEVPSVASPGATPSQQVVAKELWEEMLALCPPAHHELLRLKRQGLTLGQIAARTGMHEGSIRRILYDLARQMANRQSSADKPPNRVPED
jgi:RNA polymerase sigma-70 factor (ECF subfamily)